MSLPPVVAPRSLPPCLDPSGFSRSGEPTEFDWWRLACLAARGDSVFDPAAEPEVDELRFDGFGNGIAGRSRGDALRAPQLTSAVSDHNVVECQSKHKL